MNLRVGPAKQSLTVSEKWARLDGDKPGVVAGGPYEKPWLDELRSRNTDPWAKIYLRGYR